MTATTQNAPGVEGPPNSNNPGPSARKRRKWHNLPGMITLAGFAASIIPLGIIAAYNATAEPPPSPLTTNGAPDAHVPPGQVNQPKTVPGKPAASVPAAPVTDCSYAPWAPDAAQPRIGLPPQNDVVAVGTPTLQLQTNLGTIQVQLDQKAAPCTVNSFVHLAGKNFFDDTQCRLNQGGVPALQCGDPIGNGAGGPGYRFEKENLPTGAPAGKIEGTVVYAAGTVGMAHGYGDSRLADNGSQFFIVYKDTELYPDSTVIGKVTQGLNLVHDGATESKLTITQATIG